MQNQHEGNHQPRKQQVGRRPEPIKTDAEMKKLRAQIDEFVKKHFDLKNFSDFQKAQKFEELYWHYEQERKAATTPN